ncbi:MAG: hypothetical protein G01um101456_381 [Parcubacteria group bacterium Gr01-1014_56]|nr:MAG: hypothetical protein G01um101456_381 [Parcubacteria group bacterium Gr01-1014_56]
MSIEDIICLKKFTLLLGDGRSKKQVLAGGHYDGITDTAKKFIASPRFRWASSPEEVDLEIFELGYHPSSDQAFEELLARGLEEPTEEDVLRFGEKYPDIQLDSPVVFFHKANLWPKPDGSLNIISLFRPDGERWLACTPFGGSRQLNWNNQFVGRRPRKKSALASAA